MLFLKKNPLIFNFFFNSLGTQESMKDESTTTSNGFDSSKLKYERHCTDFSTDGYATTNTRWFHGIFFSKLIFKKEIVIWFHEIFFFTNRIGNGNRRLPPAGCYDDNMDDDDALMSSLEKYR